MSQHYTDPKREDETYALPDVEVWEDSIIEVTCRCGVYQIQGDEDYNCPSCGSGEVAIKDTKRTGWFFWFCLPGCMPDSDPYGPFDSEDAALEQAREDAGVGE